MFNFSGTRPTNLGVKDGKLAPCPGTPNCVSSQSSTPQSKIAPLQAVAISELRKVIEGMDVVDTISKVKTVRNDKPLENVIINKITIENK